MRNASPMRLPRYVVSTIVVRASLRTPSTGYVTVRGVPFGLVECDVSSLGAISRKLCPPERLSRRLYFSARAGSAARHRWSSSWEPQAYSFLNSSLPRVRFAVLRETESSSRIHVPRNGASSGGPKVSTPALARHWELCAVFGDARYSVAHALGGRDEA